MIRVLFSKFIELNRRHCRPASRQSHPAPLYLPQGKLRRGGSLPSSRPSASAMRNPSFHLAMRWVRSTAGCRRGPVFPGAGKERASAVLFKPSSMQRILIDSLAGSKIRTEQCSMARPFKLKVPQINSESIDATQDADRHLEDTASYCSALKFIHPRSTPCPAKATGVRKPKKA